MEQRDAQCHKAAARRAKRSSWAAIDPPDDGLIQLLPTVHAAPSDHLTGRRRKTTLVLVVILATMAMGSRGALWKRERILWKTVEEGAHLAFPCHHIRLFADLLV